MPERLSKLMPWILLCLIVPVVFWGMGRSEEIADAAYLLLFLPLLWACVVSQPIGLILMTVLLTFIRLILQFVHSLGMGLAPAWSQLLAAGLAPGILYVALTVTFLGHRFHQERLRRRLLDKARLESMGQLAGGLAHDINNLCSVILGTAQLMRANPALAEPLRQDVAAIIDATHRAAAMAQQFMGLHQSGMPALQPMDLNLVVDNSYRHVKPIVGPDVELEIRPAAQPLMARLNELQVNQLILNLCTNAAEAMNGHGRIIIRTESRQVDATFAASHNAVPGDYAMLSVIDHGAGMSSKTMAHIFEPFFTTKPPDRGVGLGLVVVRDILRQHGGFVTVQSEPGRGSTFSVYLPLLQPSDQEKPQNISSRI